MNARTQRMIDGVIGRFLSATFEATNEEAYTDVLTIMEKFEDYKADHASSYVIDSSEVLKKVNLVFPDAKVTETKVFGITKKLQKPGKVRRQPTAEELEAAQLDAIQRYRFHNFLNSRGVDYKTAPFNAADFATYRKTDHIGSALLLAVQEASIQDCEKWLKSKEWLYYDDQDRCWHFHSREVPFF